jgi:hypothetical protein
MKLLEVSQSWMAVLRAIKILDSYLSTYLNIQVVSVNIVITILRMQLLIKKADWVILIYNISTYVN